MDIGTTDPLETVAMAKELGAHDVQLVDAPGFRHARRRKGRPADHGGGRRGQGGGTLPAGAGQLAARTHPGGRHGFGAGRGGDRRLFRAARLLAASEAIRLGGHFGFEPANLLDVCDALGGAAMGQMLRTKVASRRFKTGLQLGVLHANVALADAAGAPPA